MKVELNTSNQSISKIKNRPTVSGLSVAPIIIAMAALFFSTHSASATGNSNQIKKTVKPKAFVYTELQISVPFKEVPWQRINQAIKRQPGFINKTWLSGVGTNSGGGFYAFDSIENAQKFVTSYFPKEAKGFGAAQSTKIFDAGATEEASRDMNSLHYDGKIDVKPGAFVYTEVQVHAAPFNKAVPWRTRNPLLKQQPGLIAKTWLSGLQTGTPGGFYAFDTLENARKFAVDYFPTEAAELNAAYSTAIFDANATEGASRDMNSPFYD